MASTPGISPGSSLQGTLNGAYEQPGFGPPAQAQSQVNITEQEMKRQFEELQRTATIVFWSKVRSSFHSE